MGLTGLETEKDVRWCESTRDEGGVGGVGGAEGFRMIRARFFLLPCSHSVADFSNPNCVFDASCAKRRNLMIVRPSALRPAGHSCWADRHFVLSRTSYLESCVMPQKFLYLHMNFRSPRSKCYLNVVSVCFGPNI